MEPPRNQLEYEPISQVDDSIPWTDYVRIGVKLVAACMVMLGVLLMIAIVVAKLLPHT